ncbi:unnamed protein product [Darwinula stevensoni]|uniref:Ankyrin n=1 Tax=Darwinula stevensoni TaxID=69355 RepID=A0A7R8XF24_9CRUS|nr:unnamed protein product [Darwinula stevensoni]CAG0890174.1 unnamed protein product [Darwinula stevensoni]
MIHTETHPRCSQTTAGDPIDSSIHPLAFLRSPVTVSPSHGYPEAAHLLLVRGAPVDALDDAGYSALHLSAEHGRLDLLRLLLEHGACVNFTPPGEECKDRPDEPLRLAIRNNHYEAARLLLEAGAHPNTRYFLGSDINLVSPLSIPFLELLLAFGAVPDARDRDGNTPLMKACRLPHGFDAALLLIHHGADVNAQAWERHDNRSVLHYAVLSGNPKIVNLVLKQGARVNFPPDYLKPTPLHLAILKGEPIIVRQLIEAGETRDRRLPHYRFEFLPHANPPSSTGADVKAASPVIGTALQVACADEISNRMEMLRLLLGSGADPNAIVRSEDGVPHRGALAEYLASNHNPEMGVVRLLLEYGAKVGFGIGVERGGKEKMALKQAWFGGT